EEGEVFITLWQRFEGEVHGEGDLEFITRAPLAPDFSEAGGARVGGDGGAIEGEGELGGGDPGGVPDAEGGWGGGLGGEGEGGGGKIGEGGLLAEGDFFFGPLELGSDEEVHIQGRVVGGVGVDHLAIFAGDFEPGAHAAPHGIEFIGIDAVGAGGHGG